MSHKHNNNGSKANWLPGLLTGSLAGLVLGALLGTLVMFLWAPRSGEKTRSQLMKQGAKLRHQAADSIDEAVTDVMTVAGDKANQFTDSVQNGAEELQHNVSGWFGKGRK